MPQSRLSRRLRGWPWLLLGVVLAAAVWHVVDFESDLDGEFPAVARATYSPYPPAAYRLAEPGDTLDRVSMYLAGAGIVLGLVGMGLALAARRPAELWPAAVLASAAAWWHAATPGPAPDGWHTLGWRVIADASAPLALRAGLALALAGIGLGAAWLVARQWPDRQRWLAAARSRRVAALLACAIVLVFLHLAEPGVLRPAGYWTRWALAAGLLAWNVVLFKALPPQDRRRRLAMAAAGTVAWGTLTAAGLGLIWFHRPIPRLKEAVAGRIYISAMPDYKGLELAHARHHFKTIINLFPEDTPQRSVRWPQELAFVRDHGIRYVRSPADPELSDAFRDETLRLARDPDAWPILVHCHGCMDRTPAWLGMYRFLYEDQPLELVLQEIEQHRGYRPKASVTLLYNHVLPRLAPERWACDPTARLLEASARGVPDPYETERSRLTVRGPKAPDASPSRTR